MKAFPMFVLPPNNFVIMKIMIVEITRPITKITAGALSSNSDIESIYYVGRIKGCMAVIHRVILTWKRRIIHYEGNEKLNCKIKATVKKVNF